MALIVYSVAVRELLAASASPDASEDSLVIRTAARVQSLTLSSDGALLAACEPQGITAGVWALEAPRQVAALFDRDRIVAVHFVPKGNLIAVATDRSVKIWDLAPALNHGRAAKLQPLLMPPDFSRVFASFLRGEQPSVVTYQPVLDVSLLQEGEMERGASVSSLAASSDGSQIATGTWSGGELPVQITVVDTCAGQIKWSKELPVSRATVLHTAFSPDGKCLYTTGPGLAAWEAKSGRQVFWKNPSTVIGPVDVSSAGQHLAAATADSEGNEFGVGLWDAKSGEQLRSCARAGPCYAVLFLPSSRYILMAGKNPALEIWDTEAGESAVVPSPDEAISNLQLNAERRVILSSSDKGVIRAWRIDELLSVLTQDER